MSHDPYVIAAFAGLFLFALYRRFRRLFGRQPLRPTRMKLRMGVLTLLALLIAVRSLHTAPLAAAGLAGFLGGGALAFWGLRLTRLESTPQGIFYTPNAYIGVFLSAVLLVRLVYRFQVLYPVMQSARADGNDPFSMFQRSPLTLAMFGLVIGYYLAYYAGLLLRSREMRAQPADPQPVDAASPPSGP